MANIELKYDNVAEQPLRSQSSSRMFGSMSKLVKIIAGILLTLLLIGGSLHHGRHGYSVLSVKQTSEMQSWRVELRNHIKENNIKIVALVFYGRMPTGSILNSYLERDLKRNGGLIDEVQFLLNADKSKDVNYLAKLVARNPKEYSIVDFDYESTNKFMGHYQHLDRNTLYIKMDDDVVYVDDLAIDYLIAEKIKRPKHFLSANVINHPLLTHVHVRKGALHPFRPVFPSNATNILLEGENITDWRVSDSSLPGYRSLKIDQGKTDPDLGKLSKETVITFELQRRAENMDGTPLAHAGYNAFDGCTWKSWTCGAVAHYSLLRNVQHNTLQDYDFGMWDFHADRCDRWSVNFFAFFGREIIDNMHLMQDGEDEITISQRVCEKHGSHSWAVGKAIVAHFSYSTQREGMARTDLVAKYRALAIEKVGYVYDG